VEEGGERETALAHGGGGGREVGENRGAGLVGWYGLADVGRFK
jgi:hypothetical protein